MDCYLIADTYAEFQVNIFCNNRDITKCQFLDSPNDDDTAIAIPKVFTENNQAKNAGYQHFILFPQCIQDFFLMFLHVWNCGVKG